MAPETLEIKAETHTHTHTHFLWICESKHADVNKIFPHYSSRPFMKQEAADGASQAFTNHYATACGPWRRM